MVFNARECSRRTSKIDIGLDTLTRQAGFKDAVLHAASDTKEIGGLLKTRLRFLWATEQSDTDSTSHEIRLDVGDFVVMIAN
jgi:hypothetical protein